MKIKIFIFLVSISAAYCGGSSKCEPLVSNTRAFQRAFFDLVYHFQSVILDISASHPIFSSALIELLKCRTNSLIELVGNAISLYSGVDNHVVVKIINGTSVHELAAPLDCISDELIFMQQLILTLHEDVTPILENSVQTETTPNNCSKVKKRLLPYIEIGYLVINQFVELLTQNKQAFSLIGLEDLFLENLDAIVPSFKKIIGIGLGSLLNADGNVATQFLSGEIVDLPYPFNCVERILSYVKNNFSQILMDFYDGKMSAIYFSDFGN